MSAVSPITVPPSQLHPKRFANSSANLSWVVQAILGREHQACLENAPRIKCKRICVSREGFVTAGELGNEVFIGHALEFSHGLTGLVKAAGLTRAELLEFGRCYRRVVTDYRTTKDRCANTIPLAEVGVRCSWLEPAEARLRADCKETD